MINNSYNARLDRFSDRVVRGEILSGSGDILAMTNVAQDGSESRYYPYGSMFAHTVGYSTRGKTGIAVSYTHLDVYKRQGFEGCV